MIDGSWVRSTMALALMLVAWHVHGQSLAINEVIAANPGVIFDEDGDAVDCIELFNFGEQSIDLAGYGLTDNSDEPMQWIFPSHILEPEAFLVVFCSEKNRTTPPFHTNFRLNQAGEGVWLTSPEGLSVDVFPVMSVAEDYSAVRLPDGYGGWERTVFSSPGAANVGMPHVAFSHPSGRYNEGTLISASTTDGLTIRYTTDGSEPSSQSEAFSTTYPLGTLNELSEGIAFVPTSPNFLAPEETVPAIAVIRAQAYDGDLPVSEVFTKTYYTGNEEVYGLDQYPIVSLVIAPNELFDNETGIYVPGNFFNPENSVWTGNYFLRGEEWERECVISVMRNGALSWEQTSGVRIHGGKTRNAPQKSLRLYSRGDLGATKFTDQLFETKEKSVFDKFVLQAQYGCWSNTMVKDAVSSRVAQGLDFDVQHAQPALVFINGVYWGVHLFRDYYDASYFEEEHGAPEESVSILLHGSGTNPNQGNTWGVVEGNNDHYLALMDFLSDADMSQQWVFDEVGNRLDIASMIDFYATAIYLNQYDWPSNNHKVWRSEPDGKWRWMMYDFDSAWGYRPVSFDMVNYAAHPTGTSIYNTPYTTFLFRKMLESDVFVERFLSRYACLLKTRFSKESIEAHLDDYIGAFSPLVTDHIARWRNLSGIPEWELYVNSRLYAFNDQRTAHAIEHISDWFGIDFNPEDYECETPIGTEDWNPTSTQVFCYPNPARDLLYVVHSEHHDFSKFRMVSTNGAVQMTGLLTKGTAIDVSSLPAGLYLLLLEGSGMPVTVRFAVQ